MNIKSIQIEQEYRLALAEVARLFEAEPETADSDYVEILLTLIEAYEDIHYAIPCAPEALIQPYETVAV